ncbi:lysozyme C, milk isozyme [Lepeophtheirus salmonis]|uniref:lysozyme n=1 Tax=Lepeophtheirus salmonis TaxID=72036 RepID=A0A0K2SY78_LEPSM|nr:lysozyme C, milk isozyme-like [Lepeophtheirus salmonis]
MKNYPHIVIISLTLLWRSNGYGKVFNACELKTLFTKSLVNQTSKYRSSVNDWLCLTYWESQFNSSAIGRLNKDGSLDYGLFQLSNKYWCHEKRRGKACNVQCNKDFTDGDLEDDMKCVERIYGEHSRLSGNGFNAWVAWKARCRGHKKHSTSKFWRCKERNTHFVKKQDAEKEMEDMGLKVNK